MTYDIVLWKAKKKATQADGLIALLLSDGFECKSVMKFPQAKLTKQLETAFECDVHELPFEASVTSQGAVFGLSMGDDKAIQLSRIQQIANRHAWVIYDFQTQVPTDADTTEFERISQEGTGSEDEQDFLHSLEKAQQGTWYDMHRVASCFRYGTGTPQDLPSAIEWYTKAAKAGMVNAYVTLAELYQENIGDEASLRKGFECLRLAADASNIKAMTMFAEWLRDGIGCTANLSASIQAWQKLLPLDAMLAGFELARAYESGVGVPVSKDLAIEHYRLARASGHPDAYRNLKRLGAEQ